MSSYLVWIQWRTEFPIELGRPIYTQTEPLEPASSSITTILVLFPLVQVFPASSKTTILVLIFLVVQVIAAGSRGEIWL